ncbi:metallophosphoesterase [Herbaspirillum sp. RV1423]|uniref:metallophosphoesterase family protein n=1 Tax=Herbaspirillum sp. RV1423 TaxID=1443993 RepID=UPI0004B02A32|nr:metallophosphoesterase [Herbaspirillum sp. RV1423]
MATILHISDLHRDADSGLTTTTLLESLRLDRERYVSAGISAPDLAIVSGDLVLGVKEDTAESTNELKRQYAEVSEFLSLLADLMFGGDRSKIVIVPGNHDVSHPHVIRATAPIAIPDEPSKRRFLAQELARGGRFRWNANELLVREIIDREIYSKRLEPFAEFYSSFYHGSRIFSLQDEKQCEVFDYPSLNLTVVGLSSCSENDLYNRAGRIHPDSVAAATMQISRLTKQGRIAVAVWHHNLSGGPRDSDYVDPEFLQTLMDGGFLFGIHGHQHRPQYLEQKFTVDGKRSLAVISSGTLCGGPHTLPAGRMRAYNLIKIECDTGQCRLHVREMKNGNFGAPVWGAAYVHEFSGDSIGFQVVPPKANDSSKDSGLKLASEAASLLRTGDYINAFELARTLPDDKFSRVVAVEALSRAGDWNALEKFCNPPQSPVEMVQLMNALYEQGKKTELRSLIQSNYVSDSTDLAVRQMVDQMNTRIGGLK